MKSTRIFFNVFFIALFACTHAYAIDPKDLHSSSYTNIISQAGDSMLSQASEGNNKIISVLEYTVPVCSSGEYVAKCGDYTLGTNWLAGYISGYTQNDENTEPVVAFTYYSADASDNMKNLRKFFAGTETIRYTNANGNPASVNTTEYVPKRDELLNKFCNPSNVKIECAKCPQGGKVAASTTEEDPSQTTFTAEGLKVVYKNWKFHTIADCYVQEFEDITGTYHYVNGNSTESCYFATDVAGSVLM